MKKIVVAILSVGTVLMVPGPGEAQTRPGFEVSAEVIDYSYRERIGGAVVAQDDGTFGGLGISYVETLKSGFFVRARLTTALGSVDYEGGDGSGRIDGIEQSYGQLEFHLGKDFKLARGAALTPFVGIGGRYLEDENGGKRTDSGRFGYDREVSYTYVPVGAAARFSLGKGAAITLSGQYNWLVDGEVKSRLSSVDPLLPDVKVQLDKGSGFELAALGSIPLGRKTLSFGPFVRRWDIDRSNSFVVVDPEGSGDAIEFFEPPSKTTEFGLRLSLGF